MNAATGPRWYCVNNMGMATLCANQADAEDVASTCDIDFPRQSPHRAVQLVEVSELEAERTARIEAQQRLADMQELAAKSGLAHRMAVQAAVAEAVAAELEECAKLAEGQTYLSRASLSSILGDDAVASCHVASAIRARGTP